MAMKASIVFVVFTVGSLAQIFPFPDESGRVVCEGTIRPDWSECDNVLLPQTNGGSTVGPGYAQGQAFVGAKCQIRTLRCAGNDGEFQLGAVGGAYSIVSNNCKEYSSAGTYRAGDACILVDDPTNPYEGDGSSKRSLMQRLAPLLSAEEKEVWVDEVRREEIAAMRRAEITAKAHRRDLVAEARNLDVAKRQFGEVCYTYNQGTYISSVRGVATRVCDNILPNGARCDQSKSATTEESFSIMASISAGIKDFVEVNAGFTAGTSKSTTETLTTAITIDCPNGGYVVWYPLFDIAKGECNEGTTSSGGCGITNAPAQCEYRKPIAAGQGRLSGEYDVQCI